MVRSVSAYPDEALLRTISTTEELSLRSVGAPKAPITMSDIHLAITKRPFGGFEDNPRDFKLIALRRVELSKRHVFLMCFW